MDINQNDTPLTQLERAKAEGCMVALGIMEAYLDRAVRILQEVSCPEAIPGLKRATNKLFQELAENALTASAETMGIVRRNSTTVNTEKAIEVGIGMTLKVSAFRAFLAQLQVVSPFAQEGR